MTRPLLNEIFKYKDKKSKDQAMYEAHLQDGYTLKDIVEYIGVHYTTVNRAVRKIEGNMKGNIARLDSIMSLLSLYFKKLQYIK